jgi:hypothetical protein
MHDDAGAEGVRGQPHSETGKKTQRASKTRSSRHGYTTLGELKHPNVPNTDGADIAR